MSAKPRRSGIVPVTPEEKRATFITEYLKDANATRAAIVAGYSEKTAGAAGGRLLTHVEVKAALDARKAELAKTHGLVLDTLLKQMLAIARSDLRKIFDGSGALLPPNKWPDDVAMAVSGLEVVEMQGGMEVSEDGAPKHVPMYTKKVKLWDKVKALDKLIDMATGVHGKPTQAVQVNVNVDRGQLVDGRVEKLFGAD